MTSSESASWRTMGRASSQRLARIGRAPPGRTRGGRRAPPSLRGADHGGGAAARPRSAPGPPRCTRLDRPPKPRPPGERRGIGRDQELREARREGRPAPGPGNSDGGAASSGAHPSREFEAFVRRLLRERPFDRESTTGLDLVEEIQRALGRDAFLPDGPRTVARRQAPSRWSRCTSGRGRSRARRCARRPPRGSGRRLRGRSRRRAPPSSTAAVSASWIASADTSGRIT